MFLCEYKNILGEPNKGIHQYKIFNIAIFDVLFTVIGAYIIAKYFNIKFFTVLMFLLILGELLHLIFCVDTEVIKLIKFLYVR